MPNSPQTDELFLLHEMYNFKATSDRRPVWPNAHDLSPVIGWPLQTTAVTLRRLEIQGFVVLAPDRDYDTSSDPEVQRYGLTTEGARLILTS